MSQLNRAQRRFLGLTLPTVQENKDYVPVDEVLIPWKPFRLLTQHHGTGQLRGGTLLGFQIEGKLAIEAVLPSNHTMQPAFDI